MNPSRPVQSAHTGVESVVDDLRDAAQTHRRQLLLTHGALVLVLAALVGVTVTQGSSVDVPLSDALTAAVGQGSGLAQFVVWETLVPRVMCALLAGLLLGLSGVIFQRLVRNVLATPDIIGVTAGASAGGLIVLIVLERSGGAVQLGALLGAAVAVSIILGLASGRGAVVHRIVLMGIGISACFASVTNYTLALADEAGTEQAMRWLVGTLNGTGWSDVWVLLVTVVLAGAALAWLHRDIDALRLGDDLAAGLGTRVAHTRFLALLLGAATAAMAVSVVGPVGFVALVSGPIAAGLPAGRGLAAAGLVGAVLLVGSDVVAQIGPLSPVPTGAITALVGAPVLMALLMRKEASA